MRGLANAGRPSPFSLTHFSDRKAHIVPLTWETLAAQYPDYRSKPDGAAMKRDIGGAVTEAWLGENTCVIRLSRALNYSGSPVPANFPRLETVKGGDGKNYAYRVAEIRPWLARTFGKPDFDLVKKNGEAFDKSTLSGIKGIIAFDIHFGDATGHVDLWDGASFSNEDKAANYWTAAKRITVWKAV